MAWTAPMTAVANAAFTAAQFNTHVRDNLNETSPAKATTQGGFFVTAAANSIVERVPQTASIATTETTTSTSFTDIATVGPAVTATTGPNALIAITARLFNSTAGAQSRVGFEVTGASAVSPNDIFSLMYESSNAADELQGSMTMIYTGLTPGSNTFTMKYKASTGTSTFANRRLSVIPF